jgi:transposase InsO family protein
MISIPFVSVLYFRSFLNSFLGAHQTLFEDLSQAQAILAKWKLDYNMFRPHSSLNGQTPIEFAQSEPAVLLRMLNTAIGVAS